MWDELCPFSVPAEEGTPALGTPALDSPLFVLCLLLAALLLLSVLAFSVALLRLRKRSGEEFGIRTWNWDTIPTFWAQLSHGVGASRRPHSHVPLGNTHASPGDPQLPESPRTLQDPQRLQENSHRPSQRIRWVWQVPSGAGGQELLAGDRCHIPLSPPRPSGHIHFQGF